jgi:hypothetical protein
LWRQELTGQSVFFEDKSGSIVNNVKEKLDFLNLPIFSGGNSELFLQDSS